MAPQAEQPSSSHQPGWYARLSSSCSRGKSGWRQSLHHQMSHVNWSQELSGSLGDLGTFLPLVVALCATVQLDLGTTLLFTGLVNVLSGVGFGIPMCVQPMKTIAAVALSGPPGLSLPEVMAAGLFVGAVLLLLGLSGLMDSASRVVPGSIVRGIQLAVGLQLAEKGVSQVFQSGSHSYRGVWGVEGCLLGLAAAAFLLVTTLPDAAAGTTQQQQQQHDTHRAGQQQPQQQQDCAACCRDGTTPLLQGGGGTCSCQQQQCNQEAPGGTSSSSSTTTTTTTQQQPASSPLNTGPAATQFAPGTGIDSSSGSSSSGGGTGGYSVNLGSSSAVSTTGSSSSSRGAVPSALVVVLLGLVLSVASAPGVLSELRLGPSKPQLYLPTWQVFKQGVLKAGLAQLPLTSLNSVIAVSHLAFELFPDRAAAQGARWRPGVVAVSVGAMNLLSCWFGSFPCCHGSGGLAAQYKFGARTGVAPVLLGGMKVLLALLFGSSLLQLLQHFPQPLLGALLLVSGLELAASARKEDTQRGYAFMLLTAAAILGLKNTAVGFAVGLGGWLAVAVWGRCGALLQLWRHQRRWGRPEGVPLTGCPV